MITRQFDNLLAVLKILLANHALCLIIQLRAKLRGVGDALAILVSCILIETLLMQNFKLVES